MIRNLLSWDTFSWIGNIRLEIHLASHHRVLFSNSLPLGVSLRADKGIRYMHCMQWRCAWMDIFMRRSGKPEKNKETKTAMGRTPRSQYGGRKERNMYLRCRARNPSTIRFRNGQASSRQWISLDCNASMAAYLVAVASNATSSRKIEAFKRRT